MAILARCPICKRQQAVKNKRCVECREDLDLAKRSKRVRYWIVYRTPEGKQVKRSLRKLGKDLDPYSITDAQAVDAKYKTQRRENHQFFDVSPDTTMTFKKLTEWYLDQEPVKELASCKIIEMKLKKFNEIYGDKIVADIKKVDLQNYQIKRKKMGMKFSTIDQDLGKVKAMISMAFENDMVSGRTLKTFRMIKKQTKKGDDARDRILSPGEFEALMKYATGHIKQLIAMGYYTGMRKGEILKLTWRKVKLDKRLIRLEPGDTKDREARDVPIDPVLYEMLRNMPNRVQEAGEDHHVFLYRNKPVDDIRRGLKKACKLAGIKYGRNVEGGFTFHDLRHTYNTNMRKAGVPETVIMKITGHSTREMFDRYNTVDLEDIRKASEQFSEFHSKSNVTHLVTHSRKNDEKLKIDSSQIKNI
jgi:integrase